MTACAILPSPWEYWVPGMADVKIHSATSNAISPKPATLNSDHLLSRSACNISAPSKPLRLPGRPFVDVMLTSTGTNCPSPCIYRQHVLLGLICLDWKLEAVGYVVPP